MYEEGNGVTKDINRAAELYISSARGGLQEAKERLASLGDERARKPGFPTVKVASAGPPPRQQEPPARITGKRPSTAPAYVVQLGSFKTVEEAEAHWSQLKKDPCSGLASAPA